MAPLESYTLARASLALFSREVAPSLSPLEIRPCILLKYALISCKQNIYDMENKI